MWNSYSVLITWSLTCVTKHVHTIHSVPSHQTLKWQVRLLGWGQSQETSYLCATVSKDFIKNITRRKVHCVRLSYSLSGWTQSRNLWNKLQVYRKKAYPVNICQLKCDFSTVSIVCGDDVASIPSSAVECWGQLCSVMETDFILTCQSNGFYCLQCTRQTC